MKPNNIQSAKLNKILFSKFGEGTFNLTSGAIKLMTFVIPYVSLDGRILCDDLFMRYRFHFQIKTLNRIIEELKELQLISEKDGFLYSHFHTLDCKDGINTLAVFHTPSFIQLKKAQKRLFFYIYTKGNPAVDFYVEHLYTNTYHTSEINYYKNFKEVSTDLIDLVEQGLIEVQIHDTWYNSNHGDFGDKLREYCSFDKDYKRKKRMNKVEKHLLGFRISPTLLNDTIQNIALSYEMELLSDKHFVALKFVRKESVSQLIEFQTDLFNRFNQYGVMIYRESINQYFEDEGGDLPYFDRPKKTKVSKRFKNRYLIPYLTELIVAIFTETSTSSNKLLEFFSTPANLDALIAYFNEIAIVDYQFLLVESLEKHHVTLEDLQKIVETLELQNSGIETLVKSINQVMKDFETLLPKTFPSVRKKLMHECALERILTNRKALTTFLKNTHLNAFF